MPLSDALRPFGRRLIILAAVVALLIAAMVWVRHHQNIRRLLAGEETKIRLGKRG